MSTDYKCIHCRSMIKTTITLPHRFPTERDPALHQRCPACGRFMVPDHLTWINRPLEPAAYYLYSRCVNAYQCSRHNQYDGDCEEGKVMPKCFFSLHARQEEIERTGGGFVNQLDEAVAILLDLMPKPADDEQ